MHPFILTAVKFGIEILAKGVDIDYFPAAAFRSFFQVISWCGH